MPSNPYKEERRCVDELRKVIANLPEGGVERGLLIWRMKAQYAVSKQFINDFLDDHIKAGIIRQNDGVLHGAQ